MVVVDELAGLCLPYGFDGAFLFVHRGDKTVVVESFDAPRELHAAVDEGLIDWQTYDACALVDSEVAGAFGIRSVLTLPVSDPEEPSLHLGLLCTYQARFAAAASLELLELALGRLVAVRANSVWENRYEYEKSLSKLRDWSELKSDTQGHNEQVQKLCDGLGEQLRMKSDDRSALGLAARYHDVGLYLASEGAEAAVMFRHPELGAYLVEPLSPLAALFIRQHHETVDGFGFPNADPKPSVGGNVLALAEYVVENLTGLNRDQIRQMLSAERDGRFLPPVLDAALA
ncbi:MAG: HD domain-containing protein, partial [Myxococcota bacterium]